MATSSRTVGGEDAGHAARAAAGFEQAVGGAGAEGAAGEGDFDLAEPVQEGHPVVVADLGIAGGDLGLLRVQQLAREQARNAVLDRVDMAGVVGQAAVHDLFALALADGQGERPAGFGGGKQRQQRWQHE